MQKILHIPRADALINALLPSWPVLRQAPEHDPWDPTTQEDARLIFREDQH
ncbi:hypothetical protein [Tropicibacter naphthalenivorans]|nr:hypothetical protein [Tropicibacter naphthalenivorans]